MRLMCAVKSPGEFNAVQLLQRIGDGVWMVKQDGWILFTTTVGGEQEAMKRE